MRGDIRSAWLLARRWNHFASRQQAAALLPLLPLYGPILDLGCGRGGISNLLAVKGHRVIGVDRDGTALQEARVLSDLLHTSCRVALVQADVAQLPFSDDSTRAIVCNSVLEHVDAPRAVLAECARLLQRGGYLGLTTPNRSRRFASRLPRTWQAVLSSPEWLKRLVLSPEVAPAGDLSTARSRLEARFLHNTLFAEEEILALLRAESLKAVTVRRYMACFGAVCHDVAYAVRGMRQGPWPYVMLLIAQADRLLSGPGKGFAVVARLVDE